MKTQLRSEKDVLIPFFHRELNRVKYETVENPPSPQNRQNRQKSFILDFTIFK